jgi:hypothetical protein
MSQNQKKGSDNPFGNGHENYGNELNVPIALKVFFLISLQIGQ